MNMKQMLVLAAAVGLSVPAVAANGYAYDDAVAKQELIVTVPAGETNVFDASYLVSSVTNFIKRGEGGLDVNSDISAGTFTITVEKGTYKASAAKSLGRNSGKIIVRNGATLWNSKGENDYSGKTCEVEGFGVDGVGALFENGWPISSYPFGKKIVLTGDTLCSMGAGYLHQDTVIDMGGHDFYIRGYRPTEKPRMLSVKFQNPGNIYSGMGYVTFGWAMDLGGDASNVYRVENGWFDVQSFSKRPAWSLEFGDASGITCFEGGAETNQNVWAGPVALEKSGLVDVDAISHIQNESQHEVGIGFAGKVSGGGFRLVGRTGANWRMPHLHLLNGENDFTGGVSGSWGCLDIYRNGALPADGAPLSLADSSCVFHSGREELDLPKAVFSGSGTVSGGFGFWRESLTKTGSGTLNYDSSVGADVLDIQGGSVSLPISTVASRAYSGLLTGVRYAGKSDANVKSSIQSDEVFSDAIATGTEMLYKGCGPEWLGTNQCICYSGYIWNRESTNVTWTFAGGMFNGYRLAIDDVTLIEQYWGDGTADIRISSVTLTPGPHKFLYKSAVTDYTGWEQGPTTSDNVNSRGTYQKSFEGEFYENWISAFGLVVDRQGRGTRDNTKYEKLIDPGDGSLLTICRPGIDPDPEVPGCPTAFLPTFETVKFSADGTLALDGSDWTFTDVEGIPSLENVGNVRIDGTWTVPAAAMGTGTLTCAGTATFGTESVLAFTGDMTQRSVRKTSPVTLVTAEGGIVGLPAMSEDVPWKLSVSQDGKSLVLTAIPKGLSVIIR